ncbi:MAG: homoserine kinase [Candidatus Azotimanducaceae bacterium]
MGVYTQLSETEIKDYLTHFDLGELLHFEPITTGIENSNYRVTTQRFDHEFYSILTLVEGENTSRVPWVIEVMKHLSHYGLPIPKPRVHSKDGVNPELAGRPTLFMECLPGQHLETVQPSHCHQIGTQMGRLHSVATAISNTQPILFDSHWMTESFQMTQSHLSKSEAQILSHAIEHYESLSISGLPRGLIHGDLFKDNVLFQDDSLVGMLDFFHLSEDLWLMDLAIALNDWCFDAQHRMLTEHSAAMIQGYENFRPLEPEERSQLPALRMIASARFALTRLETFDGNRFRKDPFDQITRLRQLSALSPN